MSRAARWWLFAALLVVVVTHAAQRPRASPAAALRAGAVVPVPLAHERIGRSVLGRPIGLTRLGAPDAPRKVLVVGAIHGDEGAGRAVVAQLIADRSVPGGRPLQLRLLLSPTLAVRVR